VRFAAVTLPETALRRSWLVAQLQRYCHPFAVLLAQLAPRRWTGLAGENTQAIYYALMEVCGRRFSIWYPEFYADEDPTEGDPIEERLQMGIPVDLLGLGDDEIEYGKSPTYGFIGYLMENPEGRRNPQTFPLVLGEPWKHLAELQPFYGKHIESKWSHAPRGREWRGVWRGITLLAQYVMHDTGNWMLDVSNQEALEDYNDQGNPPWTLEDVLNCEREYKRAKPIIKAIEQLRAYVDERPGERLPLLAAALTGDAVVRRQLSRPKRVKTLAEVLA
jgi:hypothetical protein